MDRISPIRRLLTCSLLALAWIIPAPALGADSQRPNFLWLTSEDNGPHLGAYGDDFAGTPNLDALAEKGLTYLHAWSTAPVCAPARTAIITGMDPTSLGAHHMRSMVSMPDGLKMYPQYLREAGYYCTNNRKEDYNVAKPGKVWDESSGEAHWKNRGEGQPFFAVFNFTVTHESRIRRRPHKKVHDPAGVHVPAYHPDTPEVRQDWAQYYDKITEMDALAGEKLKELEEAGLADETIVFYYGDHGIGLPRGKRYPYNSGLRVPLIVYIPEAFEHLRPAGYEPGGKTERLVAFVDLAPTVLSLAGVEPPAHMHGRAFAGVYEQAEPRYIYGFRGRMDERYDMIRSVRDKRYIYLRNYMPHEIYGQHVAYMFQTPTTRVWKSLYDAGGLMPPRRRFWEPKPAEELYDLENDPEEIHNLAGSPEHRLVLERFRQAHRTHVMQVRDLGFLPEDEIHRRSRGRTPYELARNKQDYPLESIFPAAQLASSLDPESTPALKKMLGDDDSAVRYWGAMGALMRGPAGAGAVRNELRAALEDSSPSVRVIAARALAEHGRRKDLDAALPLLVELADVRNQGLYIAVLALNALDALDAKALPLKEEIAALPLDHPSVHQRMDHYLTNLTEKILDDFKQFEGLSAVSSGAGNRHP